MANALVVLTNIQERLNDRQELYEIYAKEAHKYLESGSKYNYDFNKAIANKHLEAVKELRSILEEFEYLED